MVQPSQQFDMEEPLLRRPGMPIGAAIRLVAQPRDDGRAARKWYVGVRSGSAMLHLSIWLALVNCNKQFRSKISICLGSG
jgi:hypothetical protein